MNWNNKECIELVQNKTAYSNNKKQEKYILNNVL